MNQQNITLRTLRIARAAGTIGLATACLGLLAPARAVAQSAAGQGSSAGSPVLIGEDGKLSGPMSGWAWIAASPGTTVLTPSPCNESGCFKDTKGQLCTRGTIPALECSGQGTAQLSCNWESDWGVVVGMNATNNGGPWGASAPSSVSFAYHGGRAAYRLNAHVAGDPESKNYCVDGYQSGQVVSAPMLKSKCWAESGDALGSFQKVDKINLEVMSAESPVAFDYCITAIAVNGTASAEADGSHVGIADNGKLGGRMSGYAWVAGGTGTVFDTPQPCNQHGCFRHTQGRLCGKGNIAPLVCTGQGTPQLSCDWRTNWGGMIGMNANAAQAAWGAGAPLSVALKFSGPPAVYRLMAHVAGDPSGKVYCVDRYQSGQVAPAPMLKSECWSDAGQALASYEAVDKIGLQIMSDESPVLIDVCVSDIWLK